VVCTELTVQQILSLRIEALDADSYSVLADAHAELLQVDPGRLELSSAAADLVVRAALIALTVFGAQALAPEIQGLERIAMTAARRLANR